MRWTVHQSKEGALYPLLGVSETLYAWIRQGLEQDREIAVKGLSLLPRPGTNQSPQTLDRIAVCLAGTNGRDIYESERLAYDLWHAHRELGPYPCPHLLARYQADRAFYADYRDHVAHSIRVYLLGLYLYGTCDPIRSYIDSEIEKDSPSDPVQEFVLRWKAAALAHDIGYVLENDRADPNNKQAVPSSIDGPSWKDVKVALEEALHYPLHGPFGDLSKDPLKVQYDELLAKLNWHAETIQYTRNLNCFGRDKTNDANAWDDLDKYAKLAGMPKDAGATGVLSAYYTFGTQKQDKYGRKFLDHGVTSALLLVKVWHAYRRQLGEAKKALAGGATTKLTQDIAGDATALDARRIFAAAGACATHNVDPDRYNGEGLELQQVFRDWLDTFLPELKVAPWDGSTGFSLCYLLRLADTLQCWGRPLFRALREGDAPLEDREVSLRTSDDGKKVLVRFLKDFPEGGGDPARSGATSLFNALKTEVGRCVNPNPLEHDYAPRPDGSDLKETRKDVLNWDWQAGPGSITPPSVVPYAASDPGFVHAKIRTLMPRGAPVDPSLFACTTGPKDACPVRTGALEMTAEFRRVSLAVYETGTVVHHLTAIERCLDRLLEMQSEPNWVVAIEDLQSTHESLARICQLFEEEITAEREYPRDTEPLCLQDRLKEFFLLRLACQERVQTATYLASTIVNLRTSLSNPSQRDISVVSGATKQDVLDIYHRVYPELKSLHRAWWRFARHEMAELAKIRSFGIADVIGRSLSGPDGAQLDGYLQSIIERLPHNLRRNPPVYLLWKKEWQKGMSA